jgi:hypothetical protein
VIKIIPAFLIVEPEEKSKIGMNTKGLLRELDE